MHFLWDPVVSQRQPFVASDQLHTARHPLHRAIAVSDQLIRVDARDHGQIERFPSRGLNDGVPLTRDQVQAATDRRKAKRLKLVMRVRVRNSWGVTDIAQTRDVSKAGLCFLSNKIFTVSEEVHIILPFAANSVPVESKGKIVWSNLAEGSAGRYYGVSYLK